MKLYTKQGDDGKTGLYGGHRVSKNDPRVVAYGAVDETNASIGWSAAVCKDEQTLAVLRQLQSDLFTLGTELATPAGGKTLTTIQDSHAAQLEAWIDRATDEVPPLTQFVLPGGGELSSRLHLARTVSRRAERQIVRLTERETVSPQTIIYINRLSDLLFALARLANHREGIADIPWKSTDEGAS